MRARKIDSVAQSNVAENRNYKRILVLLDGSSAAEQAITAAVDLAPNTQTEIVLICMAGTGMQAYIDKETTALRRQHKNVRGYLINEKVTDLPAWVNKSEKPDAIVMTQKPVGWIGRLLGGDHAAVLKSRTNADVYTVKV